MDLVKRSLVPLVVLCLVVAAAVSFLGGDTSKTLVAHFPRAISVYEGSDVRVLGVAVGTVTRVEPTGTDVTVTMTYDDEVRLPADARAVIIAPSVVGDRYVQLTPAYLPAFLPATPNTLGGRAPPSRQTIKDSPRLSSTLAGNSDELFGSVEALGGFMETLAANDRTVRQFNQSLADVSTMLAGERQELVAATKKLSVGPT